MRRLTQEQRATLEVLAKHGEWSADAVPTRTRNILLREGLIERGGWGVVITEAGRRAIAAS